MRTVHEVSELTGVTVRALQHYDKIGLLHPSVRTGAGYRLYDDEDLMRLQQIMFFRELEFPLKTIKDILSSPNFDLSRALSQQIELLELKRDHLDGLIALAKKLQTEKGTTMSFEPFDTTKIDEYTERAKASWGSTAEWADYQKKSAGRTKKESFAMGKELMELFVPFGRMAAHNASPSSDEATEQAKRIQTFISDHFYTCSDEVFSQLGSAYGCGGEFTQNINAVAGKGAAEFAARVIEAYLSH